MFHFSQIIGNTLISNIFSILSFAFSIFYSCSTKRQILTFTTIQNSDFRSFPFLLFQFLKHLLYLIKCSSTEFWLWSSDDAITRWLTMMNDDLTMFANDLFLTSPDPLLLYLTALASFARSQFFLENLSSFQLWH